MINRDKAYLFDVSFKLETYATGLRALAEVRDTRDDETPVREPPVREPPVREPPPPRDTRNVIVASGGDAIFTTDDVFLKDTLVLGGYRSCLMGNMGFQGYQKVELQSVQFASLDPNAPPDWDGTGTFWASRMYGIGEAKVHNLLVKNLFGKYVGGPLEYKNTNEGHGLYWTLSPYQTRMDPDSTSRYVFEGYHAANMGGHPLYLTTALCVDDAINGARCGNAQPPSADGKIVIRRCDFKNTDQSPVRGAYAISLPDPHCKVVIDQTRVVMNGPNYYQNGNLFSSRGLLMCEGYSPGVLVKDSYFEAKPPSDRTAQIWMEGPEVIELRNSTFDCQQISLNHPLGDNPNTRKTKVLRISGCSGDADVLWGGKLLGKVSDLNGEWIKDR